MSKLQLKLISAGVKSSNPLPPADLYIDCRGIPNPVYAKTLGGQSGDVKVVQDWVKANAGKEINNFTEQILNSIPQIPTRRNHGDDPFEKPYVVAFLCAHGIHRSRSMKNIIGERLKGMTKIDGKDFTIEVV